jgi:large subunit ribosomal protein L6
MVNFTVLEPGKYLRARGSVSYTPQHTLAQTITALKNEDGTIAINRENDERTSRSLHGLSRTLVNTMVLGVT